MSSLRILALPIILMTFSVSAQTLRSAPVHSISSTATYTAEATTEAIRQSVLAAQVAGHITELSVKAGDKVRQGQILVRIDARAASQQAAASRAQVDAARAQLAVARKELERQRQLFAKNYISQAALEQAEAQFKATEATLRGNLAQAGSAQTQTGFFILRAPFSGVIAQISAETGDMAMPGKPLLTLYDPTHMRVVANLPQALLNTFRRDMPVHIHLGGDHQQSDFSASKVTPLPTVNPETHTIQIRLEVPAGQQIMPGQFARAIFPLHTSSGNRLFVPASALIHRTELDAVYVISSSQANLRQVRVGERIGQDIEILSGVREGEQVALDPITASRQEHKK